MNHPRILFLDIDGVLNGGYGHSRLPYKHRSKLYYNKGDYVNIYQAQMLGDFCLKHQVHVILVSSWAICNSLKDLAEFFEYFRIGLIGTTEHCGGSEQRGEAVLKWVEDNKPDNWAILDDAGDRMYSYTTNRVDVHGRFGINYSHIEQLEEILTGQKAYKYP